MSIRSAIMIIGCAIPFAMIQAGDDGKLKKAVSFYASFDKALTPEVGVGTLSTRVNGFKAGTFEYSPGYDKAKFRIANGKGVAGGGCLEAVDILLNNGRIFFPMKTNLAFKKGGWGGAFSMWINTDPNTLLKTTFCDPIQITQNGANNGGIWFDFNNAKPRDMRMGAFPAVPKGKVGAKESDVDAPMVRVPNVGFKFGEWHHVVVSWANFDTGKADAISTLYIDGKKIGDVKDRPIAMDWDVEKAGIFVAVNYIGLIDEMVLFSRAITADEVARLHASPGLLSPYRKK